jgi:hypothetical protein
MELIPVESESGRVGKAAKICEITKFVSKTIKLIKILLES